MKTSKIELKNAFDAGKDTFPDNVVEASRRLDNWRPLYASVPKPKDKALQFHQSGDVSGKQHYEQNDAGGNNDEAVSCVLNAKELDISPKNVPTTRRQMEML
jgi:hypothetical protein